MCTISSSGNVQFQQKIYDNKVTNYLNKGHCCILQSSLINCNLIKKCAINIYET